MNDRQMREKLISALAKPITSSADCLSLNDFDPWEDVIHGIYGGYSSDCDRLMIAALKAVRDRSTLDFCRSEGLAGELALYVLAGHQLTDYGTSPRGGWPAEAVADLWGALIEKWEAHSAVMWRE